MSIGPEDFEAQDRLDDEQEQEDPHCEYCGMNLEVHPCICGPAGPRIGGVWTGGNAVQEREREERDIAYDDELEQLP